MQGSMVSLSVDDLIILYKFTSCRIIFTNIDGATPMISNLMKFCWNKNTQSAPSEHLSSAVDDEYRLFVFSFSLITNNYNK
jgi:hypothetical protein